MTNLRQFKIIAIAFTLWGLGSEAFAHGLIQSPPSRNWFCGAITKPDEVSNGVAQFPVCGGAFALDQVAGYNFMSVLTHTQGRSVVGPRPNVCGFNAETFNGGQTVWDQPIDWPTTNMTPGPQTFTWNISWGPHFSDTAEFRYWITKPSFTFQVGRRLSFDDFEDQPFCTLAYNDAAPTGNPAVTTDKANALFRTQCNVPVRSGRHVIYAEWGRNQFTFERFHGCVDVVFQGGPVIDARFTRTPNVSEITGAGTMTLDATTSLGTGLSYRWEITAPNPSLYTLSNASAPVATLTFANPTASANVAISLVITSPTGTDTANITLVHRPTGTSQWFDLGQLTSAPRAMTVGNRVSLRIVQNGGQDSFIPDTPLVITAANAAATVWPQQLAQAVNALNGNVRIGLLNNQNQVVPVADATANHVFSLTTASVTGVFLQVGQAAASCRVNYQLVNQWGNGFQANVTITNTSTSIPVVGYTLTFSLGAGETFASGWNATYLPSGGTLSASNTAGHWNGIIQQNGGNVSFGFLGAKGASAAAVPTNFRLNGELCSTTQTASLFPMTSGALLASWSRAAATVAPPPAHHCSHMAPSAPSTTLLARVAMSWRMLGNKLGEHPSDQAM